MAEIGVTASIIGCVDFGAKLSLALFEFAAKLHTAPAEINRLAQDITVFCSVLRQIDNVFSDNKDTQFSDLAISTIGDITTRCHGCLQEIEKALEAVKSEPMRPKTPRGERKDEIWGVPLGTESNTSLKLRAWRPVGIGGVMAVPEDPSTTLAQRMKWVFRRSRVALLRQNLESMTITLHLMLTTLHLSRCNPSNREEPQQTRESIELVAENLVLMHELAIKDLEQAEISAKQELEAPTPRTKSPESKNRSRSSTVMTSPTLKLSEYSNSAFLAEAVSCDMADGRISVATFASRASIKSTLLATKWTISKRYSRGTKANIRESASQFNSKQPIAPGPPFSKPIKRRSASPEPPAVCVSQSLQYWADLSTYWESTVSEAMLPLQSGSLTLSGDPTISQLCNQISNFSTTCGSLSRALDDLQKTQGEVKADYERFLQSSVRNQEKLVGIVEKREAQVLELRNQHSIDVKQLIARIADLHTELEHTRVELESTKATRDHLQSEVDDLKLDIHTATEEVQELKSTVQQRETAAENAKKEMEKMHDQLSERDSNEDALRKQIANEKAQRLKAIQCLTGVFPEGDKQSSDDSAPGKDPAIW